MSWQVCRIVGVRLHGFRGWATPESNASPQNSIATDADVILLSGANGVGKTSLLEAIALMLTNHALRLYSSLEVSQSWDELVHGKGSNDDNGRSEGFDISFDYKARRTGQADATAESCVIRYGRGGEKARFDEYWNHVRQSTAEADGGVPEDLLAAASCFFHERVPLILDELSGERRRTLVSWVRPLDPALAALREETDRQKNIVEDWRRQSAGGALDDSGPRQGFITAAAELSRAWNELRKRLLELPAQGARDGRIEELGLRGMPEAPGALGLETTLKHFARGVADWRNVKLSATTVHASVRAIHEALDQLLPFVRTFFDQRRLALSEEHERLIQHYPQAEQRRMMAAFIHNGVSIDDWLKTFRGGLDHWQREMARTSRRYPVLEPLCRELGSLDGATLVSLAATARATVEPWREAARRLKQIEAEQAALAEGGLDAIWRRLQFALGRLGDEASMEDERLKRLGEREQAVALGRACDLIEPALAGLQRSLENLPMASGIDQIHKVLVGALTATLTHFFPGPGFLPIRLQSRDKYPRAGYAITTRDGRGWADLSSGQKAQLALGYVMAQALALGDRLPFRVLLLDDTSSAFDLGNVVRHAAWLRQLAYSPDPERRWQVFLSCHDEGVAVRLRELLAPPAGASLAELKFTQWSPDEGPQYDALPLERRSEDAEEGFNKAAQCFEAALDYHLRLSSASRERERMLDRKERQ
ncbi:MAG: AAA family ATPase [Polyangiaceae bacterium]|nr:AAA family ATPase [Polyangiaceae bacterium]